ncbi:hypothetical protein [Kibdelosporangium phytohabitans]|uniref:Anti-sigma factor n=1 Tax=Kibdelosporangium phytohabitans TaxID=860235 RepID=A0A0N9IHK4_9PSEU|nr:hypothetical protein [Kibdelosporangium phytohabitans]ALG14420.1 hypothetical protein AOZ06_52865 [Kibdelosporangium phytohabitans]MBE1466540.1 hypothetical protein [Kibdelosporangium phytohabitans]
MTSIGRGSGGPPWSVDLLADLQAGALDPRQADELWPRVNADPEAMEILAALEATQADLREFADAPAPPMPAHFAAQLDAAIAAESQARSQGVQTAPPQQQQPAVAPVVSIDAARKRRNRGWAIGVFAAAAAAVGITFAALPGGGDNGPSGNVAAPGPLSFEEQNIGPDQLQAAKGGNDYGPFSDKQKLAACFEANGISRNAEPLGAKQVTVGGKQGTLFVLASTPVGTFRLLAVGPDCGPGNPSTLANKPGVK